MSRRREELKYNKDFVRNDASGSSTAADSPRVGAQAPQPNDQTVSTLDMASGLPGLGQPSTFTEEFVMPYRRMLERQHALTPVLRLIELLERYGDCPSVVLEDRTQDQEAKELSVIRNVLARVSLRTHTLHVARWALKYLGQTFQDADVLTPMMLTAALGHDVGKIPAVRALLPTREDHPDVSVMKVRDLFEGSSVVWLDQVVDVIQAHHRVHKETFATLLRHAESRAREDEVASAQGSTVTPWDEWFRVGELLERVFPAINMLGRKGKWPAAISMKDSVYCQPSLLHKLTLQLAATHRVVDILLIRSSNSEMALRRIVKSCQSAGVLAGEVGDGYYGLPYAVRTRQGRVHRIYAVPFKMSAFGVLPSVLEARKVGFLTQLLEFRPLSRGGGV